MTLALDLANTARAGHFTDAVRMNLAAVLIRLKNRKKEAIAQNPSADPEGGDRGSGPPLENHNLYG